MFHPYADEKYHAFRYGELLEEAARERLAHAAESKRPAPFHRLAVAFRPVLTGLRRRPQSKSIRVSALSPQR
jgi:hypothetical protein